jgi:nucleoporin NUP159
LHIATTDSVRKAFEATKLDDTNIRLFEPQAKIPLPTRIAQLAFTADEQYLVLSAEAGGGLAVYDVQSLSQGNSSPAFELSTNGEALRALVPNPDPELAHFCALVTDKGNLLIANLRDRTANPLGSQVSCAAWSRRGKQVAAGLADGRLHLITPEGKDAGHIPKPPSLGDYHGEFVFQRVIDTSCPIC